MNIVDLPVPPALIAEYERRGIQTLYPPQAECVDAGLFSAVNQLIAIPTASGKTLVAELAMHHQIAGGGKCLYIVPLKALASEKYDEFSGKGVSVGISTGDFDRRDEFLGRNDIIIATSEKVDSLLRNRAHWLPGITLLVIDEVHLIDSEDRGPTLEMVITKLRYQNPDMQIIALSATIGNPEMLGEWLDATVVTSIWRPVALKEGVYYQKAITFADGTREIPALSKHDDINLCADTIEEGGQCLVFVSSRRNAEAFAKRAAQTIPITNPALDAIARTLEAAAETDMGKVLAACVRNGAAFHHAGLRRTQRAVVEKGFREGNIRIISSTPTLAAGINLPARRVIIRDYLRFQGGQGMVPIPVREYRQMAGRAGRPHLDPYGEAVLIAGREEAIDELFHSFIEAPPEDVSSRIANTDTLHAHILSLIATGFARSRDDLVAFMEQTFFIHQKKKHRHLTAIVNRSLRFLTDAEMATETGGVLAASRYGALVSRLYIDPRSAEMITTALRDLKDFSDIGLLQLLCRTPDMYTLFVRKSDLPVLEKFYFDHEEELWTEFSYDDGEQYFRSLKTAMLLFDWTAEVGDTAICERYGVGPGDIYNAVEGVSWLIHAAGRLAAMMEPAYADPIRELEVRVKHGIKRELLPLVALKGIGRVRARRLFNNNITTPDEMRRAGPDTVAAIIGRGIAEQALSRAGDRTPTPADSRKEPDEKEDQDSGVVQSTLFQFEGGGE
ncbi:MAG: ATP-dependent DNA helicase [Methanomicrobiaceae archaeon]|nr:ATP-dependent DNA helicase [Methanomicrobiaceae archaeon]